MSRTPFPRVLPGSSRAWEAGRDQRRRSTLPCTWKSSTYPHFIDSRTHKILDVLQCRKWVPDTEKALESLNISLSVRVVREVLECQTDTTMAVSFFKWATKQKNYRHTAEAYAVIVRYLGRSDELQLIYNILKDMEQEDCPVTPYLLTEVIMIFGRSNRIDEALKVFTQMRTLGCRPNVFAYNCLISILTRACLFGKANSVYKKMSKIPDCKPDAITYNMLIDNFGKCGKITEALGYLEEMKRNGIQPNVKTYTSLIGCFCRAQKLEEACRLFNEIKGNRTLVNKITFTELVKGLGKAGNIEEAIKIFREMEGVDLRPDQITYNILIHCLGKAGRMQDAAKLFEEMETNGYAGSVVTFNSLISGFCRAQKMTEAYSSYERMLQKGISPTAYTYAILMDSVCKAGAPEAACHFSQELQQRLFAHCKTACHAPTLSHSGFDNISDVGQLPSHNNNSKEEYRKDSYVDLIGNLMKRMDGTDFNCNVIIHNVVLDGLVKAGKLEMAYTHFRTMQEKGCHPDKVSHNILIHGFGNAGNTRNAFELFLNAKKLGLELDLVLYNTVIDALARAGRSEEIQEIIDEMTSKGLKPDKVTYTSVFNAVGRKDDVATKH